ncbi:PREDICTED: nucleoporin p58/p45-like isoform X1 [Polistes canadensis]|uniref:nucleoporin p58/p45-like isoform X1 n=1 Tax=Polistes canadensis TaxID=91411 RepID=UPI00071906A4|nr:PREDICTED: nucleoporin p58/p45-like isoform X1 [Polistes canadensis]
MSSFTFGTPTITSSSSGFGFGTQSTSFTSTTPATGLTFGTSTPATTSNLNFGFGATPTTATPNQPTGTFLGTGTATTTATPNFFSTPTTSTAPLFTGRSFGTPVQNNTLKGPLNTTPATGGLMFGTSTNTPSLFGSVSSSGLAATKLTTTTTTTATVGRGLGGLDVSVNNKGLSQGSNSPTAAKENLLPNELWQTIDKFKEFVKKQKVLSSDIARGSARPLNRCAEDTASLMELLTTLAGSVQRDRAFADKLKQDTAKALQNAEIAQRTNDTPSGLQYENNAPLLFFIELAENFEHDLMLFRSQIETTEKHIQTMMAPKTLTPQELTMAMSKLHESLVAVAGKLQGVHSKVQQQKEQYLNFRKYVLKDNTNVFDDIKTNDKSFGNTMGRITSGPTPFGPGNRSFISSTALNSTQAAGLDARNSLVWGNTTPVPSAISTTIDTPVKPPTASLNFNTPTNLTAPLSTIESNANFQLQKPPIGNKRGKH